MRWLFIPLAAAIASCGDASSAADPAPEAIGPHLGELESKVFAVGCATASCHGAANEHGLVLKAGGSYAALVGVSARNAAAAAQGLKLVEPGAPERSFLLQKVTADRRQEGFGTIMPPIGDHLDGATVAALTEWIRNGAAND